MIKSIRYFLLISLLLSITIASAINGIGNYLLDEQVIQPYLDGQLVRVASLISILNKSTDSTTKVRKQIIDYLSTTQPITKQKFLFQVWSKSGGLLMASPDPHTIILKDAPIGFTDQEIHGDDWRIYSSYDETMQSKIIVAELYNIRRELADDIARSNANILLITSSPMF